VKRGREREREKEARESVGEREENGAVLFFC